ncbi:hypothetical protein [Marinobacter confluentis]|uniref:Metallophosphoesterase n=1 Tax=Marinobacter confluentis TaxID=1697557 RepID=A0A4Z1C7J3_9GAMM|nr:hypothetical protein [Marinobacter confluentis]TGN39375.1 hypothetical protein E5Q11_12125 [Marinobacter confluentis]
MTEGRNCPLAYRYRPEDLCAEPERVDADVLYVIGGLYGNPYSLDEIERMAAEEERNGRSVALVFNGDFNWFNASDSLFRSMNERVLKHTASLGNVDYELANPNDGAGCGCAYPDFVDQGVVERSNAIMERLQGIAVGHPDIQERLNALPRFRCLMFGGLKVLVLHGDPESLAGWGLAYEAFEGGNETAVRDWFGHCGADVIACTHTCLPVLWSGQVAGRLRLVANNGSAGMGNLVGDARGLITRIAAGEESGLSVASFKSGNVSVSLQPVAFDNQAWLADFDRLWPPGSAAAESYRRRLVTGTSVQATDVVFPRQS